jgi:membrane protein implicated in regulation of membrane protease activity
VTLLWWHWLVLGLILALGEAVTPGGFFLIFFGVAAVVVGLLAGLNAAGPAWMQLLLFSALAVGSLMLFRGRLLRWMQVDPQRPVVDALVGEIATTSTELAPGGIGKVELRGSSWSARNVSDRALPPGARCRVVRVDGLLVNVAPEGAP